MTAIAYASDLSDIYMFETTGGVTAYGGGGAGLSADPDFAMEGTNSVNKQITAADKGFMYDATSITIGADDHFYVWIMGATPGLNDSRDNHGIHAAIGDSASAFVKFHVDGNDTLPLGGGKPYAIRFVNTTLTNFRTLVGSPGTTPSWVGGGLNTTASVKGANLGVDAARIGTGYDVTGGDTGGAGVFSGLAADDVSTSEGIFQPVPGGYALQGKLRFGSSGSLVEFTDSNTSIAFLDSIHSLTDFTEILLENASSVLTLSNVSFIALGTNNPGRFETLTDTATWNMTGCTFQNIADFILGSGCTWVGCTWINCDQVTANSADLNGSSIEGYEGTADTAALIWDTNVDPNGELDNMSFTKGSAATHALELGTTSPLTVTLTGHSYSGYNAANGQNDSTILVSRTTDTVTINFTGDEPSYKTAGATVVVQASADYTINGIENPSEVTILDRDIEMLDITGSATTLAFGNATATEKMGQSFQVASTAKVERVRIRLRKVGTPTDGVRIRIVNGVPGSTELLVSTPRDAADITTSFVEYDLDLDGKTSLTASTTYGFEIERTGAVNGTDYYEIEYDTGNPHTSGTRYIYNTSWGSSTGDLLCTFMEAASDNELYHVESVTTGTTTWSHNGSTREIEVLVMATSFIQVVYLDNVAAVDKSNSVVQTPDRVFSNP